MSAVENAIIEGFDHDPTNPEWAKAVALMLIARAIRDTDIAEPMDHLTQKVRDISNAIESLEGGEK